MIHSLTVDCDFSFLQSGPEETQVVNMKFTDEKYNPGLKTSVVMRTQKPVPSGGLSLVPGMGVISLDPDGEVPASTISRQAGLKADCSLWAMQYRCKVVYGVDPKVPMVVK